MNCYNQRHFLVIQNESCLKKIELRKEIYTIGRAKQCDIVINDPLVSRCHATLVKKKSSSINLIRYLIVDGEFQGKKSRNGLFMNGIYQSYYELKDGDSIALRNPKKSKTSLKIEYSFEEDSLLAKIEEGLDLSDISGIFAKKS